MASVFLRTHIVHMKLGHCGMEYINIACLMLIAVAFMRSVPQIGYLLFFLRKLEFQAEPGKEREGCVSFPIHRDLDFPFAVYAPYRMKPQERLNINSRYGKSQVMATVPCFTLASQPYTFTTLLL